MSKESILKRISNNKPLASGLPKIDFETTIVNRDLRKDFVKMVEKAGSTVHEFPSYSQAEEFFTELIAESDVVYNCLADSKNVIQPNDLEQIEISIIRGQLGVAENGAIWIDESNMTQRTLPFITEKLILVLDKNTIVADMYAAYKEIDLHKTGFGVFISGPSKTADIEQSLVIGAHGPVECTVILH